MMNIDVLEGVGLATQTKREKFHTQELGNLVSYTKDAHLRLLFSSGAVGVMTFHDDSLRFKIATSGHMTDAYPVTHNEPYMIEKNFIPSDYVLEDGGDKLCINYSRHRIELSKSPFNIAVKLEAKSVFKLGQAIRWNERELFCAIEKSTNETFYGTGLRRTYPLNESSVYHRIEKNTWDGKSVPFYMSSKGYGMFVNTTLWDTNFDFTEDQLEITLPKSHVLDMYVFLGDYQEILFNYHQLTGMPFMPPKWSLGYWTGRYSYRTQEEVLENARKFRKKNIPCDLLFLDLMWRGVYVPNEVTDLTWDYDCFPNPNAMIEELNALDIKLFTHVNTTCNINHKDFTNPRHIEVWRKQIMPLIHEGAKGFMVDGGEGKGMNENFMNWNVLGGKFHNGMYPEEMANIWGLLYNKTVIEAMRDANPEERMFGLTRAATAGSQRYGLIWFGDHECTWDELKDEIKAGMNMSMSGLPFWTMDIGGIQGEPKWDLFIRWLQFGCFVSVTRTHGRFPKEPWLYGVNAERISRDLLNFRMRMLPYIYHLAWEMHNKGLPPVRPMTMSYPHDENLRDIWDQWLFGDALLVAPIYQRNQNRRHVILPEGNWLHLKDGCIYSGKENILVDAPIENIPVFMKEGSVLPLGPVVQSAEESIDKLTVYIYPSADGCEQDIYMDNGRTVEYLDKHEIIKFVQVYHKEQLKVTFSTQSNGYKSDLKEMTFRIIGECSVLLINEKVYKTEQVTSDVCNCKVSQVTIGV